jgi:hypothetical protein
MFRNRPFAYIQARNALCSYCFNFDAGMKMKSFAGPASEAMPAGRDRLRRTAVFGFLALLVMAAACSKSAGVRENTAFVAITQTVPGISPLDILSDGTSVLGGSLLGYGQTTGTAGNPYVQATAGVRLMKIIAGTQTLNQGNTAFQQGYHYSLFVYDSLQNDSVKLFILQDNQAARTDTFTYVRFINFSPGTYLNLVLTNQQDTIVTGFLPYAGNKQNTNFYPYRTVHIGYYGVRAFVDTLYSNSFALDSFQIDFTKIYTGYLEGKGDSIRLKSIQYN